MPCGAMKSPPLLTVLAPQRAVLKPLRSKIVTRPG